MNSRVFLFGLGVALLVATPARPQPDATHGAVEMCQVHYVQDRFSDCEMCDVAAGSPESCANRFSALGYEKKCRTRGDGRSWAEVWCLDRRIAERERRRTTVTFAITAGALLLGAVALFKKLRPKQKP